MIFEDLFGLLVVSDVKDGRQDCLAAFELDPNREDFNVADLSIGQAVLDFDDRNLAGQDFFKIFKNRCSRQHRQVGNFQMGQIRERIAVKSASGQVGILDFGGLRVKD